jgi:hypothetical protein
MKIVASIGLCALALSSTACVARTVAVSVDKKAYVMKGSIFGTNVYACKAEGAKPVCTQVAEAE